VEKKTDAREMEEGPWLEVEGGFASLAGPPILGTMPPPRAGEGATCGVQRHAVAVHCVMVLGVRAPCPQMGRKIGERAAGSCRAE
jgi:hypothetical protein